MSDELWPHFKPLWTDLRKVASSLLLAGGYGLFLKQKWLIEQIQNRIVDSGNHRGTDTGESRVPDSVARTVIEIGRWINQTPRVTKDFDFIAELDLIASPDQQAKLHAVLERHDFKAVPGNERWQFAKKFRENQEVILDFHAPEPRGERSDLRVEDRRIKPKPSLKSVGIHGRKNPEAVGCELEPFSFALDGCEIFVSNPITWTVMKLVAMRDQWNHAQDPGKPAVQRNFFTAQAGKHAQDVFRIVAMMTMEENDRIDRILAAVRSSAAFFEARSILRQFFGEEATFGRRVVRPFWHADDAGLIREILTGWFQEK